MANINITQGQLDNVVTAINNRAKISDVETKTSAMTKAQFNALAEERKANRAGSGFDSFGWGSTSEPSTDYIINEGLWIRSNIPNVICLSRSDEATKGTSKSKIPIVNINGVQHKIFDYGGDRITLPTAPTIYPHNTVLTPEQIASGVIKHADASNSGLIVNGKFDTDMSGWKALSCTLNVEANRLKIVNNGGINGAAQQGFSTVVGKKYIIEFELTSGNVNMGMQVKADSTGISGWSLTGSPTGRYTYEYTATSTTSYILFSPYSNSAGAYGYVGNIAIFPADAISRSDLVFLESWHEDVSEKDFVYPLGNVQYLGTTGDSGTPVAGAFVGSGTYSLFGNWQASGVLIGKGYVWSSLTEAQKRAFLANPENNCYLDGDKVIQVRYRVRVVQAEDTKTMYIATVQGKATSQSSTLYTTPLFTDYGAYYNTSASYSYASSYAIPIALVHRRNQGAYHPVYNPNGANKLTDVGNTGGRFWYDSSAIQGTTLSQMFTKYNVGGVLSSSEIGSIASAESGRPDGLFYDQVHEGDILDLRNSSKKVEDYNRLISREFNKLVTGTYRGQEGEWEVLTKSNVTLTYGDYFSSSNTNNYLLTPRNLFPTLPLNIKLYGIFILIVKSGYYAGKVIKAESLFVDSNYFQIGKSPYPVRFTDGSIVPILTGSTVDIVFARKTTRTKSNTLLHCDIIGNPTNYHASWKQSGVFGTPLIVAEDGTSLLPDGAIDTFKLSRKANATPLLCLRSTNNGATWTSFTPTFSTTTNAITLTDEPTANLVMVYYQTHTSMAVPTNNSEILSFGYITAINYNDKMQGGDLVNTLIGKTPVGVSAPTLLSKPLKTTSMNPSLKRFDSSYGFDAPTHETISFYDANTPAVKILPYITGTNGKAYLNLVFKEMRYNGTSWGDDNKFNIVDNVSTTTDNNAQTVLIGQKTVELPYFIDAGE